MAVYSTGLLALFGCAMMWMLLGVRWQALSRWQRILTPILFTLLSAINQFAMIWLGRPGYGKLGLLYLQLPLYFIFWYLSSYRGIKLLFVLLTAVIFTSPTILVAIAVKSFFIQSSWAILIANLISYGLILILVHVLFQPGFHYILKFGDNQIFWMFSIIPLLYYAYGYARTHYYFGNLTVSNGFFINQIPQLIVYATYLLLFYIFKNTREKKELESNHDIMRLQLEQSENNLASLHQMQEQTTTYRHDMRHHFAMLSGYLHIDDTKAALSYIEAAVQQIDAFTPKHYCENISVNLLLSSFAERAKRQSVAFKAETDIIAAPGLPETELCALLANGLENALNAATACGNELERLVYINCQSHKDHLLILIRNPYKGNITMRDGLPLNNQPEHGFGIKSIFMIVNKHNGILNFDTANGIFTLKIMMPMEK